MCQKVPYEAWLWPGIASLISTETLQNVKYSRENSRTHKFYTSIKSVFMVRKAVNEKCMTKVSLITGDV
jgi:hypothetical protein